MLISTSSTKVFVKSWVIIVNQIYTFPSNCSKRVKIERKYFFRTVRVHDCDFFNIKFQLKLIRKMAINSFDIKVLLSPPVHQKKKQKSKIEPL